MALRRKRAKSGRININNDIKAKEVRVIDPNGEQVGVLPIQKALEIANSYGLDLVEVASNVNPSVCKIMDYGRYKYEMTKKKHTAKKKQSTFQVKEIKVRPRTSDHDLDIKIGHIKKFIEKKDKVKVTLVFKGREIALSEQGKEVLHKIADKTAEFAGIESAPKFEGRSMIMLLTPKGK